MELILKFAGDFKPDIQIIIGDFLNLAGISGWNRKKYVTQQEEDIERDFSEGNRILDEMQKLGGKIHYIEGNHEKWVQDFVEDHPALASKLEVTRNLNLKNRGIEYIPVNKQRIKPLKIGKVTFIHGWYSNIHHTKKTAQECNSNVIYGHVHDIQVSTRKELINGGARVLTQSIGCLCKEKAMDYLKSPCNWMLAFGVTYVDGRDGSFTHYTIPIPKYKFIWNGREYKN